MSAERLANPERSELYVRPEGDVVPDVRVRMGDVPVELKNPASEGMLYQASANNFLMKLKDIARYFVTRGDEIVVEPAAGASLNDVRVLPKVQVAYVRRVRWAILAASPLTPWKSNCFPQALTAKILLRRRNIRSTLYLGAAFKTDAEGLQGHAWLRCVPYYITGGDCESQFGAIASFAD